MKSFQKKEKYFQVCIMPIDYALILSAGLGTRMGEVGKLIPKVLWPVYFKTLLELQINYCQDLGIKKIYVNTHYLHHEIIEFLKSTSLLESVTILHEDPLLDSGGAIHNLAARDEVDYKGNLLLVNGDQFLFFEEEWWLEATRRIHQSRAVLFGIRVDKDSAYNETVTQKKKLIEIKKNTIRDHDYITYSGLGLLNLNGLKSVPGISRFFETVANYNSENVELITPSSFEYWDFGTADIYAQNIFKLKNAENRKSKMGNFLTKHASFGGNEDLFLDLNTNSIDLECSGKFSSRMIHGRGIFQKI